MPSAGLLNVAALEERSLALAPGGAWWAGIWLQGCRKRCLGCGAKAFHNINHTVRLISPSELARWALGIHGIIGVILTGGEPFLQAKGLRMLARRLKGDGLLLGAYSGYTLAEIQGDIVEGAATLLSHLDLLIDGPFKKELADSQLAYRGSANQRIHIFNPRLQELDRSGLRLNCHLHVSASGIVLTGSGANRLSGLLKTSAPGKTDK